MPDEQLRTILLFETILQNNVQYLEYEMHGISRIHKIYPRVKRLNRHPKIRQQKSP